MLKYVFEPLTVKGITIPNRLVVAPMVTNYCNGDGTASERFIRYHETKAEGGFGLIIAEDYAIDPVGKGFINLAGIWNDGQIESHSELPKRVHRHGAKIFAQFYHCGRQTSSPVIGTVPVAPSPIPDPFNIEVPRELSIDEIKVIVEQFGDAALRLKKCGFDGVQLHGAHGYLLSEFMSPYANKRVDEYGGSFANRMRFPIEVVKKVREKVGDSFIIDYRLSGDELVPGGRTIEDTLAIAPLLVEAGIDMIHITAGVYASVDTYIPPQYVRHGTFADMAMKVKKVVGVPVVTVCRVNDAHIAEGILAAGQADLVAMGRASLADPFLPKKSKEGRFNEIRQCIACNAGCTEYLFLNNSITCSLNPSVGLEYKQPKGNAEKTKSVTVIGGGPAGMQAAISAAERGHSVTLYEKTGVMGGQFRVASFPPNKGELTSFLVWQQNQLKKLGVTVKMNTEATADNIGKSDVVILASGGKGVMPDIPGADLPHVVLAETVLEGKVLPGKKVVIIGGGQVGTETANYLVAIERKVTILEMGGEIAPKEGRSPKHFLLKALKEAEVEMLTDTRVTRITASHVEAKDGRTFAADTVVIATGIVSENGLKEKLEAAGHKVHVIGDAVAPRQVIEANREAHELAISL